MSISIINYINARAVGEGGAFAPNKFANSGLWALFKGTPDSKGPLYVSKGPFSLQNRAFFTVATPNIVSFLRPCVYNTYK